MAGKTKLELMQDAVDAKAEADSIRAQIREDVLTPETLQAIKGAVPGVGASPTKSNNDADVFAVLFHAYDGRRLQLPLYQAENRLGQRFEYTDEVPAEYHGKQVWHLKQSESDREPNEFQCRLSKLAPAEHLEEMKKAGLNPTCRKRTKNGGFATQFEADEHFRVKHPRRWAAYQRYNSTAASKSSATSLEAAVKAMLALAQRDTPAVQAEK